MLVKNKYWFFDKVLNKKFCHEIIQTGLAKEKQTAVTGLSEKLNKKQMKKSKQIRDSNIFMKQTKMLVGILNGIGMNLVNLLSTIINNIIIGIEMLGMNRIIDLMT